MTQRIGRRCMCETKAPRAPAGAAENTQSANGKSYRAIRQLITRPRDAREIVAFDRAGITGHTHGQK